MSVTISLFLYSKPGQELEEGGDVTAAQLRALGQDLHSRLQSAANILDKLSGAGWEAEMGLYDVFLSHPYLNTAAAVEEKLQDLGIDPESVIIDEWPDEEDEEIDEDSDLE
jgi:hypothetical protein